LEWKTVKAERVLFSGKYRTEIEAFELDEELAPGEVLIRNQLSLISAGTELSVYTGTHRGFSLPNSNYARFPFYPGYAGVGEILKVGEKVACLNPGDRVVHRGRHASVLKLKQERVLNWKLSDDLPSEWIVFWPMAQIAFYALRAAPPRIGDNVAVIGMGVVGNLAAQIYRNCGAAVVAGCDRLPERLEIARQCGIDFIWDANDKTPAEFAAALHDGVQIVVEAVGANATIKAAIETVSEGGTVVLLGSPRDNYQIDFYSEVFRRRVAIVGAYGTSVEDKMPIVLAEWIKNQRLTVAPLISETIDYRQADSAYQRLVESPERNLGILLKYGQG